jgi:hypothetical protein
VKSGQYRFSEDAAVTFVADVSDVRPGETRLSLRHRVTIFHTDVMTLSETGYLLALNGKKWEGVGVVIDPEVYPLDPCE